MHGRYFLLSQAFPLIDCKVLVPLNKVIKTSFYYFLEITNSIVLSNLSYAFFAFFLYLMPMDVGKTWDCCDPVVSESCYISINCVACFLQLVDCPFQLN